MFNASQALQMTLDSITTDRRFKDVWYEISCQIHEAAENGKGSIKYWFENEITAAYVANRISLFGYRTLKPERNGVRWANYYTMADVPLEKENNYYGLTIIWAET